MNKITNYIVIVEGSKQEMEDAVNEAIRNGYQPHGSLTINKNNWYYQPMVQYWN